MDREREEGCDEHVIRYGRSTRGWFYRLRRDPAVADRPRSDIYGPFGSKDDMLSDAKNRIVNLQRKLAAQPGGEP